MLGVWIVCAVSRLALAPRAEEAERAERVNAEIAAAAEFSCDSGGPMNARLIGSGIATAIVAGWLAAV